MGDCIADCNESNIKLFLVSLLLAWLSRMMFCWSYRAPRRGLGGFLVSCSCTFDLGSSIGDISDADVGLDWFDISRSCILHSHSNMFPSTW